MKFCLVTKKPFLLLVTTACLSEGIWFC